MTRKSQRLTSAGRRSPPKRSSAEAGPPGREHPEANSGPLLRAFLAHAVIRQTVETLFEAATAGSGTILLTGSSGTGKTMIVKQLQRELRAAACTVVGIDCAGPMRSDDFLRTLSDRLGIPHPDGEIDRWLKGFHYLAAKLDKAGAPVVVVVDGAERLSGDLLPLLAQVLIAAGAPSGLRLILVGRPEILGHSELRPDHDLGRSIRVGLRLERRIDKDFGGPPVVSPEKAGRPGHEIVMEPPRDAPASQPPSERTRAAQTYLPTVGSSARWESLRRRRDEPSQPAPARSTGPTRAVRLVAAGCVAAAGIGFAAVVGGWLVAETSRSSTHSPASLERVAEPMASGVREGTSPPTGGPAAVAKSEPGSAPGVASGAPGQSASVQPPDDTLAALLNRGDELLALGDLPGARVFYERAADAGSARAATALGKTSDPISFEAARDGGKMAITPDSPSIGGAVEPARSDAGSATRMPSGEGGGSAAVRLPDDTVAALLKRGDELLALGDISAARLLYERAATGGSARAATAAGKTYDPIFVKDNGLRGVRSDIGKAVAWYRKAIELGDSEAAARLKNLGSFAGQ